MISYNFAQVPHHRMAMARRQTSFDTTNKEWVNKGVKYMVSAYYFDFSVYPSTSRTKTHTHTYTYNFHVALISDSWFLARLSDGCTNLFRFCTVCNNSIWRLRFNTLLYKIRLIVTRKLQLLDIANANVERTDIIKTHRLLTKSKYRKLEHRFMNYTVYKLSICFSLNSSILSLF